MADSLPDAAAGPGEATGSGKARIEPDARLLVTGGAGFIGSAYVRDVLGRRDGARITVLDKLTYAGNRANLAAVEADPELAARYRFVEGDIADPDVVGPLVAEADAVVNFAAESHVDRSILDPEAFLRTGVIGVHVLLEAVRPSPRRAAPPDARRCASSRSRPTRSTARSSRAARPRRMRSRRARRTRRRRPRASCSSTATSSPTASTRS